MRMPLPRVQAEVHARDHDRRATRQAHPRHRIPPRPREDGHGEPTVPGGVELHPLPQEDRRSAAAAVGTGGAQPALLGERGDAAATEETPRDLLEAQHVRVDPAHPPRRCTPVVEEVAGVVGGYPQPGRSWGHLSWGHITLERARSAAPMRPASLPSCATTMLASGRYPRP